MLFEVFARFLERSYAICSVMLQLGIFRLDRERFARPTEAGKRKMVMKRQNAFWIVKTFDVLVWLSEICCAARMLQHVHVLWNSRHPLVLVLVLIEKVNVPNVVAWIGGVPKLLSLLQHSHHQVVPAHVILVFRHDHLVNV